MIEVNSQQAKKEISNLLVEVESQGTTVRIIDGEKVVAEIIPSRAGLYRATTEPHPGVSNDASLSDGYEYRTIGETLSAGKS